MSSYMLLLLTFQPIAATGKPPFAACLLTTLESTGRIDRQPLPHGTTQYTGIVPSREMILIDLITDMNCLAILKSTSY